MKKKTKQLNGSDNYRELRETGPWVERGTVRVKYLAQEHNTMSPARALTRTARSGVERTNQNHEATAPPSILQQWRI